ncbi:MAG: hypothetical protein VKM98_06840, partial [Cyanobacteriota bacterium]|nr:hypothetical protein [Cyanobacteriota bacterium]
DTTRGTDTIVFNNANNIKNNLAFGVTSGAGLVISYGTSFSSISDVFDSATSNLFSIGGTSSLATAGFSGGVITLVYESGVSLSFQSANAAITQDFADAFMGGTAQATVNFGTGQSFPTFS